MNRSKKLASQLAVALTFASLFGASAFADNRPSRETRGRDRASRSTSSREQRDGARRERSTERSFERSQRDTRSVDRSQRDTRSVERSQRETRSFDRSQRDTRTFDANRNNNRNFDRGRSNENRSNDRSFDRGRSRSTESYRNDSRRPDSYRSAPSNRSHGYRQPYYAHGRVSRYERYGGGYRVWLGGVPYPFFIPEARFRLFPRFAVGIDIRLGGYYNPRGYYDYYDGSSYNTSGGLRGQVESVDLRRGRLIVHDEISNAFVTVEMRDYGRRLDDVRIGDYIELSGDWTRIGTFIAYRLDSLDPQGGFYR